MPRKLALIGTQMIGILPNISLHEHLRLSLTFFTKYKFSFIHNNYVS